MKTSVLRPLGAAAALTLMTAAVLGASPEGARSEPEVRLRGGTVRLAAARPDARLRVVVARDGSAAAVARALCARGASILASLPDGMFLVAGPPDVDAGIAGVRTRLAWSGERAVVPELRRALATPDGAPVWLVAAAVSAGRTRDLSGELAAVGSEVRWLEDDGVPAQLGVRVPAGARSRVLEALLARDDLVWADLQPPVRLRNRDSVWRCQSGIDDVTPLFAHGLYGAGQVVGIMDTGIDIDACYFRDDVHGLPSLNGDSGTMIDTLQRKVLGVDFYWDADWPNPGPADWDDHGHGTHVAGSVAGDGDGNGVHDGNDGMAPAARLVIQDGGIKIDDCADLPGLGCPVRPLEPVLQQAYDQGARLHSNSWGDEENIAPFNRYTERTADVDRFLWNHPEMLVFFAAGNAGPGAGTVGSPATGKNAVAVGAARHGDVEPPCVASFSSRGWTQDGRIKPDVVVPGRAVLSAASDGRIDTENCGVVSMSGTSMACPTATGLAALVRQYFSDGFYPAGVADATRGFAPSGALVKATLIASAVDLTNLGCAGIAPVPSRDQGWGMVQLDRALFFPGDGEGLLVDDGRAGFAAADDPAVAVHVDLENAGPLKVVLVWTDPPSSSLAQVNLVNDLDLAVTGPGGTYLGNVFAGGVSVSGGEADRLNNVEVVWIPEAAAGRWTITVAPHAVNLAPQPWALAVTGPFDPSVPRHAPRRANGRLTPSSE